LLVLNDHIDHQANGDAQGKACDVEKSIALVAPQAPESSFEIVL
jgi:hypothetical protein